MIGFIFAGIWKEMVLAGVIGSFVTLLSFFWINRKYLKGAKNFFLKYQNDHRVGWKEYDPKYPEFTRIRAQEVLAAFKGYVVTYNNNDYHHMGSTAIVGMPGKPIVDFTIVTKDLLPNIPDDVMNSLQKLGWTYRGIAPHSLDKYADQWFFRANSPDEKVAENGIEGYAMHIVSEDFASESIDELILFRDFCMANKDAFNKYK